MLSFRDRELTDSLHSALIQYFYEACESDLQARLETCRFGFAPSPTRAPTFFIVAGDRHAANDLADCADRLIPPVLDLMPGIRQLAVCCQPPDAETTEQARFLSARIFEIPAA